MHSKDDEYEKESEFNMYDDDGNIVGTGSATEVIFVPKGQPLPVQDEGFQKVEQAKVQSDSESEDNEGASSSDEE